MFLIKVNVFYLLLWYLIRSSMANDFCETFAKNNFSINYGFGSKHLRRTEPMFAQLGALVIEDNLWTFDVHMKNMSIDLNINDIALPLGYSKVIKKAFIGIDGNIGLIDKNGSIYMTSFADINETKDKYNFKEKINFNETGKRRYIPFTFNISSDSMIIGFMAQNYNSGINQFERDVTFYDIFEDYINEPKFELDSFEITKTIYNFDKSIEILAIYGPYIMESFELKPIKQSVEPIFKKTFDYLILNKVNKSIQYFFTSDNITNQYKTLIDCTHIKDKLDVEYRNKSDSNTAAIKGSNLNKILEKILIYVLIIYIILLSSAIIYLCIDMEWYRLWRALCFKEYFELTPYDCQNPEDVVPEVIIEPIREVLI